MVQPFFSIFVKFSLGSDILRKDQKFFIILVLSSEIFHKNRGILLLFILKTLKYAE